ncbi:MAG: hypothetical protein QOJ66_1913 [Ilumatobacteraceae bacterium]
MEQRVRNELVGMIDRALGEEPKPALIAARQLKAEVDWLTERAVALARREGFDWGRISRLLGITRQWARERFKGSPPRLPPHVVARNRYLAEQREGERLLNRLKSGAGHPPDEDEDVVAW